MADLNRKGRRMKNRQCTTGFRLSRLDGLVLCVTAVGTPWLFEHIGLIGLLPAFVALHFFLFCNVFRIRRRPELVWAACFVLLAVCLTAFERMNAIDLMALQLPVTFLLIGLELRQPSYHGIFAQRWNTLSATESEV